MKRYLSIASVTLVGIATHTHAQSTVTIYGVADVGVETLNHVPDANGGNGNLVRMTSGNIAGSRWGFRGSEELGNGLKAVFVLEGGMTLDNGLPSQGRRMFGRKAYVGLDSSHWGQLTVGRHHNLTFDLLIAYDPMSFAPKYSAFSHDPWLAGRIDNAIKYTGKFGGLTVAGLYSFGVDSTVTDGSEVPGNSRVGRDMSAGFSYQVGELRVAGVFDQLNGNSIAKAHLTERRYVAATSLNLGSVTVQLGYRRLASQIAPSRSRTDLIWTGANWSATPNLTLSGALYKTNDRTSAKDPLSLVLSGDYRLSNRTDAYVTASYTRNKSGSMLGVNGYDGAVMPGASQVGAVVGLRHSF